jgi:hypothetical protein
VGNAFMVPTNEEGKIPTVPPSGQGRPMTLDG